MKNINNFLQSYLGKLSYHIRSNSSSTVFVLRRTRNARCISSPYPLVPCAIRIQNTSINECLFVRQSTKLKLWCDETKETFFHSISFLDKSCCYFCIRSYVVVQMMLKNAYRKNYWFHHFCVFSFYMYIALKEWKRCVMKFVLAFLILLSVIRGLHQFLTKSTVTNDEDQKNNCETPSFFLIVSKWLETSETYCTNQEYIYEFVFVCETNDDDCLQ